MSYQEIKDECYEANLLLPKYQLIDLTFGNVSVADRERGVFAIKPSGVEYASLRASDMVVVDFAGKIVEGKMRPSSDTPTHRRLLQAFAGVRSVVHTHSRSAVAFAQAGRGIPCLGTTHADYFYGEVPITRALTETEIAGDYELATGDVIVECFQEINSMAVEAGKEAEIAAEMPAVLVRGHGPFVWGSSGEKAVETAQALEIVASMALQTLALNPAAAPIPQALLDKHFRRKHGSAAYYGQ